MKLKRKHRRMLKIMVPIAVLFITWISMLTTANVNVRCVATNGAMDKIFDRVYGKFYEQSVYNPIYIITPTYARKTQRAELTRLSQTLMLVPNILWILVEDSLKATPTVTDIMRRMPFKRKHLVIPKSRLEKTKGGTQRNMALQYLIWRNISKGVIYFADDDNSYDIRLFETIRDVQKVGLVPTGNMAHIGFSSPVLKDGKVVDFYDPYVEERKWPIEMASIALNVGFWRSRGAPLFNVSEISFAETSMLERMNVTESDFEPKANNCTEFFVWHTKTVRTRFNQTKFDLKFDHFKAKYNITNIEALVNSSVKTWIKQATAHGIYPRFPRFIRHKLFH